MNLIPRTVSLGVGRNVLIAKKQSPHIFFAAGIVGVVGSAIMACRATLKLSDTLDGIEKNVHEVKELKHSATEVEVVGAEHYPDNQYGKDLLYVYGKASWSIAKLYGPSVVVGVASIAALSGSHIQLARRNAALMAAYGALQTAYEEYRERVKEVVGEQKELDIYRGIKTEEIEGENGELKEIRKIDPNKLSVHAKIFDEYSEFWKKDPEMNRIFVQCQQNFANHKLQARGHVFLNEVYDMLGFDHSRAGSVVGWVLGEDNHNFIDFGIFETFNTAFVNGWERSIVLDFNVDGVIWNKI